MDEIIKALKTDRSDITQGNYAKIIKELTDLGYTGKPERWHETKRKVSIVLPEKVEWFQDHPDTATTEQIRAALAKGGVDV